MKSTYFLWLFSTLTLLGAAGSEATTTTYFPLTDISGDASGFWSSAAAIVSSGPGYVEVLLVNTSPRQDNFGGTANSANPFITELEINLGSYDVVDVSSYVSSTATTLIANGAGSPATLLGVQNLYYKIVGAASPGMHTRFMSGQGINLRNDNSIGSLNILDASNIPQEDYVVAFLNPSPYQDSGAVFDSAIFHFALNTTDTPDTTYWASDNLIIKYKGGGDYSMRVANAPEPASILLIGFGALASFIRRKR